MTRDPSRRALLAGAAGLAAAAVAPSFTRSYARADDHDSDTAPLDVRNARSPDDFPANARDGRWRPPTKYGIGGVQAGNGFKESSDEEVYAALRAAWDTGARFFDTSPWYGLGRGERRFGQFLDDKNPDDYVIATKIGRLLVPDADADDHDMWKGRINFDYRFDYSADATRRSVEDSLQRLGLPKIDVVFVHDLSPDHEEELGGDWKKRFDEAARGAFPELSRMRDEGLIKGWGMGVNDIEPAMAVLDVADPDITLLATQYSLLKHEEALEKVFPAYGRRGASIVVGAPYKAGYLAGVDRFLYDGEIPDGMPEKRDRLRAVCRDYDVNLKAAALQFTAAPAVVSCTIPGPRDARQARENAAAMTAMIPGDFWQALKDQELIAENAPVPAA